MLSDEDVYKLYDKTIKAKDSLCLRRVVASMENDVECGTMMNLSLVINFLVIKMTYCLYEVDDQRWSFL